MTEQWWREERTMPSPVLGDYNAEVHPNFSAEVHPLLQPGWFPTVDPGAKAHPGTYRYRAPQRPVATAVVVGGCNHLLHAILTVMTCGLWWPVWAVAALFGRRRMLLVDKSGKVVGARRI